jgi:F0F1-type ATP synthase gamma subunit
MANTQELNRRIGATTNTRKITRAMEMVSLRRASLWARAMQ